MAPLYTAITLLGALSVCGASCTEGDQQCFGTIGREEEGGSLLQLRQVKQETLSAQAVQEQEQAGPCPSIGVSAAITDAMLNYIMTKLFPFAYTGIQNGSLPMGDMTGSASGFDYVLNNARVTVVGLNSSVFKFEAGRGLDLHVSGITASVTMDYMFKSNTWWTAAFGTNSGKMSVSIIGSSFLSALASFTKNATTGNTVLQAADIDSMLVLGDLSFDGSGSFASFLSVIVGIVKPIIQTYMQEAVKTALTTTSVDLTANFDKGMDLIPFNETLPNPLGADIRFCGVETGSNYLAVQYFIGESTSSSGGAAAVSEEAGYDLSTTGFSLSQDTMFSLAMTEWSINVISRLILRQSSLLSPEVAALFAKAPFKITADMDSLPEGREMQVLLEDQARLAVSAGLGKRGVQITDPKVRFFDRAVETSGTGAIDLRQFIDSILFREASHVKLGGAAARVIGELGHGASV